MRTPLLYLFWVVCLLLAISAHAQTPVISSTLSVSLTGDANSNGQANPTDQLSYSLVISNSGSGSATSVNLTMPAPTNTTLVTGSLKTSVLARPDSYTTLISGPLAATTVLTNDFGLPTKTVLAFGPSATPASTLANGSNTASSDQGATVLMQTNGTFTYTPTGSFVGFDKFGYTATTTTPPNDAATVTVRVGTPVTALANSYTITGNVSNTQTAPGVLGNDTGDQRIVSAVNGSTANVGVAVTTAQSGTVTVAADGSFVYFPLAGYTGPDSFTYTANNGLALPSSAVVSLTIQDMIWFVNSAAGSNGTGTLAKPFNNLASFAAINNGSGNNPAANDNIFLYSGSYTGGLTLLNNQKLIGAGATASLATITGITLAPGNAALPSTSLTDPILTNASGNGVSLAQNNLVRGLTIGTSSANALAGSGFGTLTVADLTINTAGRALALTTGAVSGSFDSVTSTAGTNNIALTTITGSFSINGGVLSGASASSFSVSGGSVSVTYSGNLSQANSVPMVNVVGGHSGTLTFQTGTLNATNGSGLQFDNADGTYNFNGTTTLNGGDAGIDIVNGSGGSFTFGSNTSITNPSGIAYREDSSTPTVTYNGSLTKTNNATIAVDINAKTGGTTAFGGSITASTTTANAIDLTNTGGTVTFAGNNLAITTTSGVGFNATGSGATVNVTGTGNTINSTTGTALNVTNTTIGASGLTFQSIAANGGTKGIALNTTGSNGLTVTGVGTTAGSGGTIQNISARGAEFISVQKITLKNMNFINANTVDAVPSNTGLSLGNNLTENAAIYLYTVSTVLLDRIAISGTTAEEGINGNTVTSFSLTNSSLANTGNGPDEDGLHFYNMLGTNHIVNTTITSSGDDNVNIQNASGTSTITITGGSFNAGVQGSGLLFGPRQTTNTTINISGVTCDNNFSGGIVADCSDGASMVTNISSSTSINNNDGISISGASGTMQFDINGNTIYGNDFGPINVLKAAFSVGGLVEGKIRNNIITVANGRATDGMTMQNLGGGTLKFSITGNTMDYAGTQRGIYISGGQDGVAVMEGTVTGNTMDIKLDGAGNAVNGILAQVAVTTGSADNSSMCIDIGGALALKNTFTHSLGGTLAGGDIRVRQRNVSTIRMPGYAGGTTDTAAAGLYLDGRNTIVSASTVTINTSISGGAACSQPSN